MFSSKTSRTYEYSSSSGNPGQRTVTETRTYIDADGNKRTETITKTAGGEDNSLTGKIGGWVSDKIGDGMAHLGITSNIKSRKAKPTEARYSRGWGSRRSDKSSARNAVPIHPDGKSFAEVQKECLSKGGLFEDPDFPAADQSIFYSRSPPRPFVWKRPSVT